MPNDKQKDSKPTPKASPRPQEEGANITTFTKGREEKGIRIHEAEKPKKETSTKD